MHDAYPYNVQAEPDGGFFISFPDVPEALTRAETDAEVPGMAQDALVTALRDARRRFTSWVWRSRRMGKMGVVAFAVLLGVHVNVAAAATAAEAEAACVQSPMMEDDGVWRSLVAERLGRPHPAALDQVPREQLAAVFKADAVADCARALGADPSVLPALMAYKADPGAWQTAWSALSSVCRSAALPRQRCIDDEVAAFRELRVREAAAPVLAQVVGTCATLMAPHDASMRGAVACADAAVRRAPSPGRVSACAVAALTNGGKTAQAAGAWLAACYRKPG